MASTLKDTLFSDDDKIIRLFLESGLCPGDIDDDLPSIDNDGCIPDNDKNCMNCIKYHLEIED